MIVLSFLCKAARDYSADEKLSSEARKLLRTYKTLFSDLSAQNQGNNALELARQDAMWQKNTVTSINDENMQVTGYIDDVAQNQTNTEGVEDARFALPYDEAIDQIDSGTLDTQQNTHLRVLEHTPQIYLDKAGAIDCEIVMAWDIAYLAMKRSGDILGNYHGLGTAIMKALPRALEDPLYIVKQKNGRIAAVTKIVVKGKRSVFASIDLETYKTTIQEGETEAKKYNLVVAVADAKPNYLQNTIFGGEIVYNKNSEDPAHFILRLKSLEKAVPTYDLAGSSTNSIPDSAEKVNRDF